MLKSDMLTRLHVYPFLAALVAGVIGYAVSGWGSWLLAGVFAGIAFVWERLYWQSFIWREYAPKPEAAPVEQLEVGEIFDPAWITVQCHQRPGDTHVIQNLPIEYTSLVDYAIGIRRDGKKTIYADWKGQGGELGSQDKYKELVQWFIDHRLGFQNHQGTLIINEWGEDLLDDILTPQFSPTDTKPVRSVRTYGDMPKYEG